LELNYWIQAFLFKLVPCILLTVLTVMLIFVMHQANRRRMKLKSQVFYRPCNRFTSIKDYYYFLAHQHKACRQLKIKQEMTAVGD